MGDLASQMLPEALNGIKLRRIQGPRDQFDLLRMSGEQGEDGFGNELGNRLSGRL